MANLNGFNASEVEPNHVFEAIPAGKYIAAITSSEMKPTKRGDGSYLELELTVIEGEYQNRKVWDRLCINHPNELTQKIARGNLSAICRAVSVLEPKDSVELHNLPMQITVRCKTRPETSEIDNEIKGYTAIPSQETNATEESTNSDPPPWKR
ncbi:hypothetical protein KS4_10740 [Poriferisphaera corsica]|uniref:DUF669 domain-containing protein n=1 Tax=Poriferisphaera corsica TaxID=2528020 RepID=A0A517YS42_9BACT|nr:DUF669 domain-containing protein [Poriferisphaera corsica]QDU33033.1 hypothetical protein KS4_10740 [Poriferisphaera corsica]